MYIILCIYIHIYIYRERERLCYLASTQRRRPLPCPPPSPSPRGSRGAWWPFGCGPMREVKARKNQERRWTFKGGDSKCCASSVPRQFQHSLVAMILFWDSCQICLYVLVRVCKSGRSWRELATRDAWLRTNGVNTNGATTEVMNSDTSGKRYALALLGR